MSRLSGSQSPVERSKIDLIDLFRCSLPSKRMRIIRVGHRFVKMVMREESCFHEDIQKNSDMLQNRPFLLTIIVFSANISARFRINSDACPILGGNV
ncbi:MAG TPA: hypothetical protein VGB07_23260 [Blastocatellia bacterium]